MGRRHVVTMKKDILSHLDDLKVALRDILESRSQLKKFVVNMKTEMKPIEEAESYASVMQAYDAIGGIHEALRKGDNERTERLTDDNR